MWWMNQSALLNIRFLNNWTWDVSLSRLLVHVSMSWNIFYKYHMLDVFVTTLHGITCVSLLVNQRPVTKLLSYRNRAQGGAGCPLTSGAPPVRRSTPLLFLSAITHPAPFSTREPSLHCQPPSPPPPLRPSQYESPWLRLWAFPHRNTWETCQEMSSICQERFQFITPFLQTSFHHPYWEQHQGHKLCYINSERQNLRWP